MRFVTGSRTVAARHPDAAGIAAAVATFVAVVLVSVGQWGPTPDGLLRGVTLGGWLAILVFIVPRRRRLAVERRDRAAVEQRLRIARELHDTVAGAVSAIGIQAAAARRVMDRDPAEAAAALERIERASRTANLDLRRMLEALRESGPPGTAPEPGLDRLPALVEEFRDSGPEVRLTLDRSALALADPALDHAAYRIVQEALTNVVRHAGPVATTVEAGVRDGVLRLAVVNGPGRAGSSTATGMPAGLGIVGMRERASLFRGTVQAGPTPDGGWAVRASLPLADEPVAAAGRDGHR